MLLAPDARTLAPFFAPEQPGPTVYAHVLATGVGRCLVDRWPEPRAVLVSLPGGNHALRGDPAALTAGDLADVAGFVDAPPLWRPLLGTLGPGTWDRVVATLPPGAPAPVGRGPAVRRLGPADAAALAALDPTLRWIHDSWGGADGLAAAGVARAVVVDGRAVSVAVPFYVGTAHEDIGVVTDPAHRLRGLSTACAAALVLDVRGRGRTPSWTTSPDNAASLGVAARLGFVHDRDDVLHAVRVPLPD
ncbi:GNAT family N-acetyltransferase [Pseudonocardia saturnea]